MRIESFVFKVDGWMDGTVEQGWSEEGVEVQRFTNE
jgi:hypothetical protein